MGPQENRHDQNRPLLKAAKAADPMRVDPWLSADGTMGMTLDIDPELVAEEMRAREIEAEEDRKFNQRMVEFNDNFRNG